jgi:UDP-galactopyranose mutase
MNKAGRKHRSNKMLSMSNNKKILIVGCGLAGSVYGRTLAEHGFSVQLIDKRNHIAGNCFDYLHETGIRIHKYGPHLFHTSNDTVVSWVKRFASWMPYEHRVDLKLPTGRYAPLPISLNTINEIFRIRLKSEEDARSFLDEKALSIKRINNAEDWLYSKLGREITDIVFRPYSQKMWGIALNEMDASIVKRIKIRYDHEDRYFPNDKFQALPEAGYEAFVREILTHPNIKVCLGMAYKCGMEAEFDYCFNSMPIDEFFNYKFGPLPYRSIRFYDYVEPRKNAPTRATINYSDSSSFTRETWWHLLPGHDIEDGHECVRTVEEPCDYADNNFERYYPVKDASGINARLFEKYLSLSKASNNMQFIGRCGTYQYLDMHQVINQSLIGANKFIGRRA